jgi:CPA2 family monovalent cation:H+ antiporter-2
MRWWLTLVARRKSEELFVLNLLLITLGLAWLTELAGLSWLWALSLPAC